jgi:23S rRNA-/tRNA-specific pseudouridylate synthase
MSYYREAIVNGHIRVNEDRASVNYRLHQSDEIEHDALRCEPPVLNLLPRVISEDSEILAIDKPPGMIIHSSGGQHYNSLLCLLRYELKIE